MSFGDPMDVFGNKVDESGRSYDKFGQEISAKDYFTFGGELSNNAQRESIYAKILGETVIDAYRKFNVILSSNVVAFAAFHIIYEEYKEAGLLQLVNQKDKKFSITRNSLEEKVRIIVALILEMKAKDAVTLSDEHWDDLHKFVHEGIYKLGIYHTSAVLKKDKNNQLVCEDIRLLYFYHNRLVNYGLEEIMGWEKV